MPISAQDVAAAHDEMVGEYDQIEDPWYAWLFARVHDLIADGLPPQHGRELAAFDAGCGTGFQSFLLARAGLRVTGVDLSERLVELARRKTPTHAVAGLQAPPLFSSSLGEPWLQEHHRSLAARLERARGDRPVVAPEFRVGDLRHVEVEPGAWDVITSCGSVLSFIDDWETVLQRLARGLGPHGRLFLEVEQKLNADLAWPLVDSLLGGRFGYEQALGTSLRNLLGEPGRSVRMDYPFEMADGTELVLPLWLFSLRDLKRAFRACGLSARRVVGIHHATNLIPSTVLHRPSPTGTVRRLFSILRPIDERLSETWPFRRLGCSVAFELRRSSGS